MITAEELTKQRGGRAVVSDVTFRCEPGTVTGFLGPNGAGKTTTMRMLVGLSEPDSGAGPDPRRALPRPAQPRPARRDPARRLGATLPGAGAARRSPSPPRPWACRRSASTTLLELVGLDETAARRRVGQVLARHAPAPRPRPRAARRPRGADPRRARQRPRSGGHALDARAAARLRRPRRHRAALLAPAGRGRGRRRPDDDHRRRTDPGAGHPRRAADRVRDDRRGGRPRHARRRASPRRPGECTPPTAIGGWSRPSPRSSPAWRWPTTSCCAGSPRPTSAGLERLFFELTTAGGNAPSPKTDPIHPELAGATA